ncbi:hypothetical protein HN51_009781 [Arachis hypogaea]|uniref:DUF1279 domain-containing protein n=1 Tax=Arachis hypogaea TaxID=3818 RepID=A0A445E553_ARAHY|nr:uncharacterized protein LOC112784320 [Arachis hypogaea]XP_057750376.1 uncharacterized protein LOC130968900 [Arachis stenosperma]QHO55236.1 uncharacterized protein DS421_3g63570 [Arachis hypogaea]RYR70578.1 hypothetical protein Ahy_A03g017050 [Arachis hypogaea]
MTTSLLIPLSPCSPILSWGEKSRFRWHAFSFHSLKSKSHVRGFRVSAKEKTEEIKNQSSSSAEDVTKKYGLEAGLWKIFSSKEDGKGNAEQKSKGDQAKELLAKYGGAYLATSITLSLISFALCYALISAGIDVQFLLQKLGISADETGEKVGTFALAYAAHKAASPIRFPPTVALTPVVAGWIGKKFDKDK